MFLSAFSWYGFLIAMGMIVGMFGAFFVARYRGFNAEVAFDICLWAIPLAVVGARLNFVVTDAINGAHYDFLKVIGFENGQFVGMHGLSIYGGLMGAVFGIFCNSLVYKHKKKPETFLNMLDLGAPFMILGQAIGRWGNLVNKELYGGVISNPAFQWFPFAVEVGGEWYAALSFYESIFNLIGSALLFWMLIGKRRSRAGFVVSVYFMWYGFIRACLELLRQGQFIMYWGGFPVSFFDSILLFAIGLGMLIWFIVKAKRDGARQPFFVSLEDWQDTGRLAYEWGRDPSEKLPPLFAKRAARKEEDDEEDAEEEPEDDEEETSDSEADENESPNSEKKD